MSGYDHTRHLSRADVAVSHCQVELVVKHAKNMQSVYTKKLLCFRHHMTSVFASWMWSVRCYSRLQLLIQWRPLSCVLLVIDQQWLNILGSTGLDNTRSTPSERQQPWLLRTQDARKLRYKNMAAGSQMPTGLTYRQAKHLLTQPLHRLSPALIHESLSLIAWHA